MTMTVHNYRPTQFHRTSNGENQSSGYKDMGSASLAATRPPELWRQYPSSPEGWGLKIIISYQKRLRLKVSYWKMMKDLQLRVCIWGKMIEIHTLWGQVTIIHPAWGNADIIVWHQSCRISWTLKFILLWNLGWWAFHNELALSSTAC